MKLDKYSFGMGDRFLHQGEAQLQAVLNARQAGVDVTPVWNKSNREHLTVHTEPVSLRQEADAAVAALAYTGKYHVDADHINLATVDRFIECSDFFTIDVADAIGSPAAPEAIDSFVARHQHLIGPLEIPGSETQQVTEAAMRQVATTFLKAAQQAGQIYRYIAQRKGEEHLIPEVSMDETDHPQTPLELFLILAALADEQVPIQTIAPKFTGRFNKGVDYVGDLQQFEREFNDDLAVIALAVKEFGLPENLKLSVHSGSDKFSIYGAINRALKRTGAGLHVKTAGTTWLEELIGLAEAGGAGLKIAHEVYASAFQRRDELCQPYATVIDIQHDQLPDPGIVNQWTGDQFTAALRHVPGHPSYNASFRQLLHVGYKVAAEMGPRYYQALEDFRPFVSRNVTANLWDRHLRPLFVD